MSTRDDAETPTARIPSVPIYTSESAAEPHTPTPASVLKWIASAGNEPWFPSRFTAETGIDRTLLDEPLNQLRIAGLVRVATWVRGAGQGYVLTPEGKTTVKAGNGLPDTGPLPSLHNSTSAGVVGAPPVEQQDEPSTEVDADRERVELIAAHFGLNLRTPLLIPVLIVANVLWFIAGVVAAVRLGVPVIRYLSEGNPMVLRQFGAVSGQDLLSGDWWRLLSCCFVHIGLLHLCANLFALGVVGRLAELLWGRLRLGIIYFISGLAGSCLAMASQPESLLAGASGAIWGVLASIAAWLMLFRSQLQPDVGAEWARRLWFVFLLNAGVSFLPGVSWEAHLGGGVTGFLASGLLNALRFGTSLRRIAALLLLTLLPCACLGGLGYATLHWEAWLGLRDRLARVEALQAARAAEQERQTALIMAVDEFNREVVPRLDRLTPETVRFTQTRAVELLMRPGDRRNPESLSETCEKLTEWKHLADEVVLLTSGKPIGAESFDEHRARAAAYASARSESFSLLLRMLETPTIPDEAAWNSWGNARRAADAAWEYLRKK